MFDSPRIFRRSDPDFPTTPAVRRRLIDAGRVEGEGPLASPPDGARHCGLCGCNINSDRDADRTISACGSCKSRPDARVSTRPQVTRAFTDADRFAVAEHPIAQGGGVVHHFEPIVRRRALLDVLQADPVTVPVVGGSSTSRS